MSRSIIQYLTENMNIDIPQPWSTEMPKSYYTGVGDDIPNVEEAITEENPCAIIRGFAFLREKLASR